MSTVVYKSYINAIKNSDLDIMMRINKSSSHVNCNVQRWTCLIGDGERNIQSDVSVQC